MEKFKSKYCHIGKNNNLYEIYFYNDIPIHNEIFFHLGPILKFEKDLLYTIDSVLNGKKLLKNPLPYQRHMSCIYYEFEL